jgi:Mg/Co/Ni transporter MgtE
MVVARPVPGAALSDVDGRDLLFGVLVPLTLQRFGADPCTASSIFLTTGTDIASMGLMLALATVLVL